MAADSESSTTALAALIEELPAELRRQALTHSSWTERRMSSSEVGQSSPMPRCAVSMASATPKPQDHRCRR